MKTRHFALFMLLVLGVSAFSQEAQTPTKTTEFRIGFKTGRTFFTNPEELGGLSSHVFYGQLAMDLGVCRANKLYYGLGIGAEYIDLLDAKVSVPLHADLRYFFAGDAENGTFVEVQAGYAFCSDQTFPITETESGQEIPVGQTVRKLSGPYAEVSVGYRTNRFDFQASYGYRAVHYVRSYYNTYPSTASSSFFKPLHTLMAGVSYKIL